MSSMSSPEKEKLNVDISTLLYWCVVGEKHVSGKGDFLRWADEIGERFGGT
jgi:hypothetical protein